MDPNDVLEYFGIERDVKVGVVEDSPSSPPDPIAPASSPTQWTGSTKTLLNPPPIFDGDKLKYREWKRKLCVYIDDPRNRVTTNKERINIAFSYIEGPKVAEWVQNYYKEFYDEDEANWMVMWRAVKKDLDKQFLDTTQE